MTLPDVCPKDGVSQCEKKACHLYMIEWRTGDEQCVIGYGSTHKQLSKSTPMEDTYAEKTRSRLEQGQSQERTPWPEPETSEGVRKEHLRRSVPEPKPHEVYIEAKAGMPEHELVEESLVSTPNEEVVVIDKDTTIIESKQGNEGKGKENKKRKSLDEVMDMDLPEDYEDKFWK